MSRGICVLISVIIRQWKYYEWPFLRIVKLLTLIMVTIHPHTSYNFKVAKVIAILTIAAGHFLHIQGFWIAVTAGLFVFAFSSGYFTSLKYHDQFKPGVFWLNKLYRLGMNLLLINFFLLVLFIFQGKPGIWTWQTLSSILGLKGFVTWFDLGNPSPFGAGLWFLTLLLIFYAVYPLLRHLVRTRIAAGFLALISLGACFACQHYLPIGHMLWLTAWGFILGVCVQRLNLSLPPWLTALIFMASAGTLLGLINFPLIVIIVCALVLCLTNIRLPQIPSGPLELLHGCLLEIYLMHTYLYIHPTNYLFLDFAISLIVIIAVSLILAYIARKLCTMITNTN